MNNKPNGDIVNKVGNYLYKHIDSATSIKKLPNKCEVNIFVLYQLPRLKQIPGKGYEFNKMRQMDIELSITTYNNKIRVNVIEISPDELTLGCDVYQPELFDDMAYALEKIYSKVCKRITKEYSEYEFLF